MKKIILLLIILLTTGCSYMELNDLAIASAIGIDYENNNFIITAQIMDVKSSDSGIAEQGAQIYTSKGITLSEAVDNFYKRYPKNIYFGHIEMGIISKNAIEQKSNEIFDYFIRSPEARASGYVLVTKNKKASEILNPKNEKKGAFPTEDLKSVIINSSKKNGTVNNITLEDLVQTKLKKGIDPVIPQITIKEKGITSSSTTISEMVPLKNNKLQKTLSKKESIGFNIIKNNFNETTINGKINNSPYAAYIYNPKSKIKVKINNNKIYVNININIETKITEIDKKYDLTKKEVSDILKKETNKEIKIYIKDLLLYCKTNETDLLGLKNEIYKNYYKKYNNYKNKNIYKEGIIKIKINNKLYSYGNINKGD